MTITNDSVAGLLIGSNARINLGDAVQRAPRIHPTFNRLFGFQVLQNDNAIHCTTRREREQTGHQYSSHLFSSRLRWRNPDASCHAYLLSPPCIGVSARTSCDPPSKASHERRGKPMGLR